MRWQIWLIVSGVGGLIFCLVIGLGIGVVVSLGQSDDEPTPTLTLVPTLTLEPATRTPDDPPAPSPSPSAEPLSDPSTVALPPRDRTDLAIRLLGVDPASIQPPTPRTYALGDVETFWVSNSDEDAVFQVWAVLVAVGEHVYMWVEEGYTGDARPFVEAAGRFDRHIYPTTTAFFGSEPNPGIDGDPRLHILHSARLGSGVAGYFYSPSQYPASIVPYSNQKEMFYINIGNTSPTDSFYDSVLAHEFQHMIHWQVDGNEESWLNEGLSELSATLNGFGMSEFVGSFLNDPNVQLTTWPEDGAGPHYGAGYLFVSYFLDRFGQEATRKLVADPGNGLDSLDTVLADLGQTRTADDLFAEWVVANVLNDPAALDGLYFYPGLPDLPPPLFAFDTSAYPLSTGDRAIHQYGAEYLRLYGPARVRIDFVGSRDTRLFPAYTINTDGDPATPDRIVWWSNRGDDSDVTLTRPLDLTDVTQASLEYDVWYWIEPLWDYAYVEVSTDGGATWQIISTPYTTDQNPNGTAFGPGYTGQSAEQPGANPDGWLHESVDLTPYAGREILIRFEVITDDAVNRPGLALDNLCLPALGWCDDVESADPGWEARGFLRHANVLPQRYLVQLIHARADGSFQIIRLELDGDNRGSLDVLLDGLHPSILIVSGLTRHTTEPALYRVDITPLEN